MKRFAILVLAVAIVGFAGQSWAGVAGTVHDVIAQMKTTNFGTCSACHIPHKSFGARLWPAPITATGSLRGDVGLLCSYCHASNVSTLTAAYQDQVFKDMAGSSLTHGLTKLSIPGSDTIDANLPYTGAAAGDLMQCTTCHNVHDQSLPGRDAFLQDDIDVLCARCHQRRQFTGGSFQAVQGPWGTRYGYDPAGTAGNPGSHPVGTDVTSDSSTHDIDGDGAAQADSPLVTGALGIVAYRNGGNYQLGPHLIDGGTPASATVFTGGIGCVTCHAVHGADNGANAAGWHNPYSDVLATNQSEMGSAANGNGDVNNTLCEACHQGASRMGSTTSYPNPGSQAWSHPVDDAPVYPAAGAGVDPTTLTTLNWPVSSAAPANADPAILCESCHQPHPLAAFNGAQTGVGTPFGGGTNSHILRDQDNAICDRCHTATMANHHPIGNGLMDGTLFDDDLIGDADNNLECSDCHNGNGAHNWTAQGAVGLDPQWEPFNNARNATDDAPGRQVINMSKECMDCHNADGRFSPTPATVRVTATNPNTQYTKLGGASHFLGVPSVALNAPWTLKNATEFPTGTFVTNAWPSGGWSRFGGTSNAAIAATSTLVCESCHELQPTRNAGNNNLLLEQYQEGYAEDRSLFCEGCHGPAGSTGTAHPQTADIVGRATLAGRDGLGTDSPLRTTPLTGAGASFAEWGARGTTWYPAANGMNCNTCHQPHDAVTASGTYILEGVTGTTLTEITGSPSISVTASGHTFTNAKHGATDGLNYQNFCNLCHKSGQ